MFYFIIMPYNAKPQVLCETGRLMPDSIQLRRMVLKIVQKPMTTMTTCLFITCVRTCLCDTSSAYMSPGPCLPASLTLSFSISLSPPISLSLFVSRCRSLPPLCAPLSLSVPFIYISPSPWHILSASPLPTFSFNLSQCS